MLISSEYTFVAKYIVPAIWLMFLFAISYSYIMHELNAPGVLLSPLVAVVVMLWALIRFSTPIADIVEDCPEGLRVRLGKKEFNVALKHIISVRVSRYKFTVKVILELAPEAQAGSALAFFPKGASLWSNECKVADNLRERLSTVRKK